MARDLSRRSIVILVLAMIVATGVTIWGTRFILHTYVMARPDPLYKAGGLTPGQRQ
jgi:hypothetical protein